MAGEDFFTVRLADAQTNCLEFVQGYFITRKVPATGLQFY